MPILNHVAGPNVRGLLWLQNHYAPKLGQELVHGPGAQGRGEQVCPARADGGDLVAGPAQHHRPKTDPRLRRGGFFFLSRPTRPYPSRDNLFSMATMTRACGPTEKRPIANMPLRPSNSPATSARRSWGPAIACGFPGMKWGDHSSM